MLLRLTLDGRRIAIRDLVPEDERDVNAVFDASQDWFTAATGQPAGPGDVQSLFYALPEGAAFEDKRLLVITADEQVVGVVDAVLHHPEPGTCSVGLFLLHPAHRRRGLGRRTASALLAELTAHGFTQVSASSAAPWPPGRAFLTTLGFHLHDPRPPSTANRNPGPSERPIHPAHLHLPPPAG